MKVNVTLDNRLVERMDDYSDNNYMSRSGLISVAVTQYLNQNEAINAVKSISLSIRKIADQGSIDEATRSELEDFERLCRVFVGQ